MLRLQLIVALAFILVDQIDVQEHRSLKAFKTPRGITGRSKQRRTQWQSNGGGQLVPLRHQPLRNSHPRATQSFLGNQFNSGHKRRLPNFESIRGIAGQSKQRRTPWQSDGFGQLVPLRHQRFFRNQTTSRRRLPAFKSTRGITDCIQRHTPWKDDGDGHLLYLQYHLLFCPHPRAMSGFFLERKCFRCEMQLIRYTYLCCKPPKNVFQTLNKTPFKNVGNGNIYNLDLHTIDCGKKSLLAGFQLQKSTQRVSFPRVRYRVYCRKMGNMKCYRRHKSYIPYDTSGRISALTGLRVACNPLNKEFLSLFKLKWFEKAQKFTFSYRCCRPE